MRQARTVAFIMVCGSWAFLPLSTSQVQAQEKKASSPAASRQYSAAVAFQNRQAYDLAIEEWEAFLEQFPQDPLAPKARHYLGTCQLQTGEYGPARENFQTVLEQNPRFELRENATYYLGLATYNLGRQGQAGEYLQAEKIFQDFVEEFPQSPRAPEALYFLGESQYARGDREAAAKSYARWLDQYGTHRLRPDVLYALGVTEDELGHPGEAAHAYDTFLREFSAHSLATEVSMRRGEVYLAEGNYEEAVRRLQAAALKRGFALADHATMRWAAAEYARENFAIAAKLYAQVADQFENSAYKDSALVAAGNCYFRAENYPAARAWFGHVMDAGLPEAAEAAHWTLRSYLKERAPEVALEFAEQVLPRYREAEEYPQLAFDRADVLFEIPGRKADAQQAYADFARQFADHELAPQALYLAGFTALELGNYTATDELAGQFLEKFGTHGLVPEVRNLAGEAALQRQDYARAAEVFATLAERYPLRAERNRWRLRHALALRLEGEDRACLAYLKPLLDEFQDPDVRAEAHYLMGSAHFALEEIEPAVRTWRQALRVAPKWRQADETWLRLALAYRRLGDTEKAVASLERLTQQFPQSEVLDRAYLQLGELAHASRDWAAADGYYQMIRDRWPESDVVPRAVLGQSWSHLAAGRAEQAITLANQLRAQWPQDEAARKALYALATAKQREGQFAEALRDVEAYLHDGPEMDEAASMEAKYLQGLCLVGLEKYAEAAEVFSQLASASEFADRDKALYEWAWALKSAGDDSAAEEKFARLASSFAGSPLAPEAHYHVAERAYDEEEYAAAIDAYRESLKAATDPDLIQKATHKLGWAYFQMEDFNTARTVFDYQVKKHGRGPLGADAQFMLAECLFKQDKYAEAVPAYQKAASKEPTNKDFAVLTYLHAGQAAAKLEDWNESLTLLRRCVERFPESRYVHEARFEQAWALYNLNELDEAYPLFEKVAEEGTGRVAARARFMLGEIQFQRKNHREAVREFFKVAYGFNDPIWQAEATFEAARCFEVLGNEEQAVKSYQELLEKYPESDKVDLARRRLADLTSESSEGNARGG